MLVDILDVWSSIPYINSVFQSFSVCRKRLGIKKHLRNTQFFHTEKELEHLQALNNSDHHKSNEIFHEVTGKESWITN